MVTTTNNHFANLSLSKTTVRVLLRNVPALMASGRDIFTQNEIQMLSAKNLVTSEVAHAALASLSNSYSSENSANSGLFPARSAVSPTTTYDRLFSTKRSFEDKLDDEIARGESGNSPGLASESLSSDVVILSSDVALSEPSAKARTLTRGSQNQTFRFTSTKNNKRKSQAPMKSFNRATESHHQSTGVRFTMPFGGTKKNFPLLTVSKHQKEKRPLESSQRSGWLSPIDEGYSTAKSTVLMTTITEKDSSGGVASNAARPRSPDAHLSMNKNLCWSLFSRQQHDNDEPPQSTLAHDVSDLSPICQVHDGHYDSTSDNTAVIAFARVLEYPVLLPEFLKATLVAKRVPPSGSASTSSTSSSVSSITSDGGHGNGKDRQTVPSRRRHRSQARYASGRFMKQASTLSKLDDRPEENKDNVKRRRRVDLGFQGKQLNITTKRDSKYRRLAVPVTTAMTGPVYMAGRSGSRGIEGSSSPAAGVTPPLQVDAETKDFVEMEADSGLRDEEEDIKMEFQHEDEDEAEEGEDETVLHAQKFVLSTGKTNHGRKRRSSSSSLDSDFSIWMAADVLTHMGHDVKGNKGRGGIGEATTLQKKPKPTQ
ncbi:hypothetical protein BGZ83_010296 [Gryganskiella cystojenkinii]|nr:hypothetical protein BGZ83_010296 [Gryganskiella cystojenkinii]